MDNFKKLINREVNKENEWRVMNEFIKKLENLMQFYDDLEELRGLLKQCYQDTPLVTLSKIDNVI